MYFFFTDAQRFVINYAVDEVKAGNFPHVGITAREGLAVLYRKCKEDTKIIVANHGCR